METLVDKVVVVFVNMKITPSEGGGPILETLVLKEAAIEEEGRLKNKVEAWKRTL